ncbi:protein kinase [Spirillospora sp. CA-255316]
MEPGLRLTERYRLVERLDGGGTGHVWRAWDEALNRPVAVRIPGSARPGGGGNGRRGTTHARVVDRVVDAVRITHPAFVTVYDCDHTRDGDGRLVYYIVTAFLEGETLAERIARGPLHVQEALECCAQVASALAAAHAAGVVHGDLRAEKVFLTLDGVRIVGLGMDAPGGNGRDGGAAREAGQAADVLALGELLGACLPEATAKDSAECPPDGSTEGPPDGSASVTSETPEEVGRLVSLCRSADPARRPTAARAAEILAGALGRAPDAGAEPASPAAGGGPGPSDATAVLDRGEVRKADPPERRPSRGRSPALDGDRVAVFRVAVTVTLVAASLAAILVVAGRGSFSGPSPGQGRSAPPLPEAASPRGTAPTGAAPAPTGAGPAPSGAAPADRAPEVFATLGRLQPIVDRAQASGAIRSDVAVDLNNSITNLRNDLASGRTGDAPLKLAQLREKIETRLRERALDDEVAARMTDVLSGAAAP